MDSKNKNSMTTVFSIKQISEMWQVSYDAINTLVTTGQLPAVKIGRQWRITKKDLDEYIQTRSTKKLQKAS
jgi:excisionase family DNA binding protein